MTVLFDLVKRQNEITPETNQQYDSESDYQPVDNPSKSILFQISKRPIKQEEESKEEMPGKSTFLQHVGRPIARSAELAAGLPGELGGMAGTLLRGGAELAAKPFGKEEAVSKIAEKIKSKVPFEGKLFPGTADVRKNVTQYLFGNSLEPKSPGEEKFDEITSDIVGLALPLGTLNKGASILRKVALPVFAGLGSNVVQEGLGKLGFSKNTQNYAKAGTMLVASMINPGGVKKTIDNLYSEARNARPANAMVASNNLENELNRLEAKLKAGGIEASDKPALRKIEDIRKEQQGALIPVESVEKSKIKVNEARSGLWENEGLKDKKSRNMAKAKLNEVSKALDDTIDLYGQQNPEWHKNYKAANLASSAKYHSEYIRNYIKKHIGKIGSRTMSLFGLSGAAEGIARHGLPLTTLATGAAAGTLGYAAMKTSEILTQIYKSPALRKYYLNTLKAAAKEDSVALVNNLNKLNAGVEKLKPEEE